MNTKKGITFGKINKDLTRDMTKNTETVSSGSGTFGKKIIGD